MLDIRIVDGKVVISGKEWVDFTIQQGKTLIVDAPEGVRLLVSELGRPAEPRRTASTVVTRESDRVEDQPTLDETTTHEMQIPGQALHAYLRMLLANAGKPMSLDELEERVLTDTAYETTSKHLRNTVRAAMARKPAIFAQVSRTLWTLQEAQGEPHHATSVSLAHDSDDQA